MKKKNRTEWIFKSIDAYLCADGVIGAINHMGWWSKKRKRERERETEKDVRATIVALSEEEVKKIQN